MKYDIQAGKHPAQVDINMDGNGGFTGTITHTEFGDGQITGGKVSGDDLTGSVNLDGHNAVFKARTNGAAISGTITPTGFLSIMGSRSFSGTLAG